MAQQLAPMESLVRIVLENIQKQGSRIVSIFVALLSESLKFRGILQLALWMDGQKMEVELTADKVESGSAVRPFFGATMPSGSGCSTDIAARSSAVGVPSNS